MIHSPSAQSSPALMPRPDRPGSLGRLVVVSGPSGVGKSTIVDRVVELLPIQFSVSATTREPRPGEVDGVDYHFVSRDVFEVMIERGEFLEWAEYNGQLYGTPRRPVLDDLRRGLDVLLEIELQGARQVTSAYPDAMSVFIAPPSIETLEQRLRERGDTKAAAVERRLEIARTEVAAADEFRFVVVNDDLTTAVAQMERILGRPSTEEEFT